MSTHLDDIAYRAQQQPAARFTALAHHLTKEFPEETWQRLNAHGAPGLSGETMEAYARVRIFRIAKLVCLVNRKWLFRTFGVAAYTCCENETQAGHSEDTERRTRQSPASAKTGAHRR